MAKELGNMIVEKADYYRSPNPFEARKCLNQNKFILVDKAYVGDILYMWHAYENVPQHFGIWTGSSIIHALEPRGSVIESRVNNFWVKRIVEVYTWPL